MKAESNDTLLREVDRKLNIVMNLLAYQIVEGKTLTEVVPILARLGFKSSEIARIFGTNPKVVSVRLAEAKKKQSVKKGR